MGWSSKYQRATTNHHPSSEKRGSRAGHDALSGSVVDGKLLRFRMRIELMGSLAGYMIWHIKYMYINIYMYMYVYIYIDIHSYNYIHYITFTFTFAFAFTFTFTLHYITLRYITLRYITLRYITYNIYIYIIHTYKYTPKNIEFI
jgi:hypothetical protein